MSTEAILKKLRYMGQQYGVGKVARGGRPEKHYLEEAADLIEQLASENTELRKACRVVVEWCDQNPPARESPYCVQPRWDAIKGAKK